ncbi:unnamed protein product, partial [Rotaria sp. Silwood2]
IMGFFSSLSTIIENTTEISITDSILLTHIQKELNDSNQISSIRYIESSSMEDQYISETKLTLSDTDITDDIFFLEWDKERNLFQDYINSLRKEIQTDTKSQICIINELKENVADLNVDLQNHILMKRRLEMSINNIENNSQLLDTERIKLTNDLKENQHNRFNN